MSDFPAPGSDDPPQSTPPGWYPDPWEQGSQRWWDGKAWTASTVRSAPNAAGEPGSSGEPWLPSEAGPGNGLSETGDWVGVVFRTAIARAGHVFPIMMLTVVPSAFAAAIFGWLSVRDARVSNLSCLLFEDDPDVGCASLSGITSSYVLPLVLAGIWWLLSIAVFHLSIAHQLHGALDETKPSWSNSLQSGLRSLPRFVLYALLTVIIVVFAYGVSVAVGALAGPLGAAIVGLLWIPLTVFLWVKLSFFFVAAAVAPSGTNLLTASSRVSDGRFTGVLGRLLLLVLLSAAVFIGSQAVSFPLGLIVGPGLNESLLESIVDEQRAPESFAIVDVITNPLALAVSLVLINVLTSSIVATIQTAGTAALYRETGGPRHAATQETT